MRFAILAVILLGSAVVIVPVFLRAEGPPSAGRVGTNGIGIDLNRVGSTEVWEIAVTLDPGVSNGLVSSSLSVSANGGSEDLPLVEIRPESPIENGEPFLHRDGDGYHSVEWTIDVPTECSDGCQLVFPIHVTQLEEGPYAQISVFPQVMLAWNDPETMTRSLGGKDVRFHERVEVEMSGPDHDQ